MEKREAIIKIFKDYGCMSSKQASAFLKRKMNLDISPQSVSGTMRSLMAKGYAGSSKTDKNTTMYWLITPAWEEVKEGV